MNENKWYFTRGFYYMRIMYGTNSEQIFFDQSLDVINFWVCQVTRARNFYRWLKSLIDVRYKVKAENSDCECADSLLNIIIKLVLPEVDMDFYAQTFCSRKSKKMAANDYAVR